MGQRGRPGSNPARFNRSLDTAILNATLAGLAELGYDRLSMDDIASRAGVGKAAIYRRWPSKPALTADAIAHWRHGLGPVEAPDTGTLRGDIEALVDAVPDMDENDLNTMKVVVGVATAAAQNPSLAAAIDELVLAHPRQVVKALLDQAVVRGEIAADRDLSLVPDMLLGMNVLRIITGRPVDRLFVRRVLEDLLLPLVTAPAPR